MHRSTHAPNQMFPMIRWEYMPGTLVPSDCSVLTVFLVYLLFFFFCLIQSIYIPYLHYYMLNLLSIFTSPSIVYSSYFPSVNYFYLLTLSMLFLCLRCIAHSAQLERRRRSSRSPGRRHRRCCFGGNIGHGDLWETPQL